MTVFFNTVLLFALNGMAGGLRITDFLRLLTSMFTITIITVRFVYIVGSNEI